MPNLPIVFVPGLMCTGRIYLHQVERMSWRHPVVLAQHWHHQTMGQIAKSILDVAPEKFALAGTSMGGYIAFEIMRQAPERVEKLILMSTSAKPDAPERSADRLKQVRDAREQGMRRGTYAMFSTLAHPARSEDIALRNMFIDMAESLGAEAFARQIAAIIGRADSRPTLAEIKVPTMVIAGADDRLITPDNSEEIASGIKGAWLKTVDNCGHMGTVEKPETYHRLFAEFLG